MYTWRSKVVLGMTTVLEHMMCKSFSQLKNADKKDREDGMGRGSGRRHATLTFKTEDAVMLGIAIPLRQKRRREEMNGSMICFRR